MSRDAGATTVLGFTDFGQVSTYRLSHKVVTAVFTSLVSELAGRDVEAVLVEVADGAYQLETARLLAGHVFTEHVDRVLFTAGDAHRGSPGPALLRPSRLGPDIAALRAQADRCIVLVHWGATTGREPPCRYGWRGRCARRVPTWSCATIRTSRTRSSGWTACPCCTASETPHLGHAAASGGRTSRTGSSRSSEAGPYRVVGLDLRLLTVDNTVVRYRPRPAEGPSARAFLESLHETTIPAMRGAGLDETRTLGV